MVVPDIPTLRPWLEVRFTRSPGPGGQNVNKLDTRVTLLLDFETSDIFSDLCKRRIRTLYRTRLSRDGRLMVVRHRERSQARNRRAAERFLLELLAEPFRKDRRRVRTSPTAASKRRRLADKRRRSELKGLRRPNVEE